MSSQNNFNATFLKGKHNANTPPLFELYSINNRYSRTKHYFNKFFILLAVVLSCFISSLAYAQDCNNLNENPTWVDAISDLQTLNKDGAYDRALEIAKALFDICPDSPTLLYNTGYALEQKGDVERAKIYYQKASENTSQMETSANISRMIWYKRYEIEHPERTEEAIQAQTKNINTQAEHIEKQNTLIEQSTAQIQSLMWTGVGVGGAGIAFLATGAALLVADKNPLQDLKENPKRATGWTLLGTGIGMAIAGSIMAGISGYQYSKSKNDAVMSFNVSPMGISFDMTF